MIRFVGMWKNWFLYKNKDGAILALAQRYDDQPQKVRKKSCHANGRNKTPRRLQLTN
jgi:hypothetical protein